PRERCSLRGHFQTQRRRVWGEDRRVEKPQMNGTFTISLRGVQVSDVNLQRGFVSVRSAGRLQLRVENAPAALQPTEWQGIPRALQQDITASSASFAYRLVEPAFSLPLKLERHEATKLLAARVNNITFTSVIADSGAMLTHVRLEILPGDKRLL
ncbi:MAG: hypothetical protein WCK55_17560, partial [Verrucomicrobiota bacterium]